MESIKIQFSSSYCSIVSDIDPSINEDLYTLLAFQPSGYYFSPKYQNYIQARAANLGAIEKGLVPPYDLSSFTLWDGYIRLYKLRDKKFRVGLLERVIEILTIKYGLDVEVLERPEPRQWEQHSNTYSLRPYQKRIVQDMVNKRFGIVKSPPRSGKTIMSVAVIDSEQSFPVVFFCRSLDLAHQTVSVFKNFLPFPIGLVADGESDIQKVTVMTIQSVYNVYSRKFEEKVSSVEKDIPNKLFVKRCISSAKLVFYDEAHHSKSDTSKFVLSKCISATLRIGLTATPKYDKDPEIVIEEVMGPIIAEASYSELIKEGFLLRPYIYMYRLPKPIEVASTYAAAYKQEIIESDFFNGLIKKIVDALVQGDNTVVVQTEYINHTKKLAKFLGYPYLTGKEKAGEREEKTQQLKDRKIKCLVSTLFEEGLDIPSLEYTINVAGGLSNVSTLQRMRSITINEGKTTCGIIDFFHKGIYLHSHSLVRKRLYKSEPEFVYIERDVSNKSLAEIL